MTSAMMNIINGTKDLAMARELAERKADAVNEQEKLAGAEQEAGPSTIEAMTPEQATDAINKLSSIVLQLTERLDGKGVELK